jgi:hypothetical protein
MSNTPNERLYNLLPTIYRIRDVDQNYQLRALMAGLESEFLALQADIDALYDNWFIETGDQWTIPYIGELVGVNGLNDQKKIFPSQRRQVANTIGYRRRKGLIATLEHVMQDATGWYAHVIEYGLRLSRTQHLAHLRQHQGRLVDLRSAELQVSLSGPFETNAHTIDVRQISAKTLSERPDSDAVYGKYLPPNIGIFFWRLRSYPMTRVPAGAITKDAITGRFLPAGYFTFDPLRRDTPLFTLPQEVSTLRQRATVINLPAPIDPVNFALDLEAYRVSHAANTASARELDQYEPQNSIYYGPDRSLCVLLNGSPIPPDAIYAANLSSWHTPDLDVPVTNGQAVAVDVRLGRLLFFGEKRPARNDLVEVSYCYGFSTELGGGPYNRILFAPSLSTTPHQIHVLKGSAISTLKQALDMWATLAQSEQKPQCIIHIHDNGVYTEDDLSVELPKNSLLVIEAAEGVRPCIASNLSVKSSFASARLMLSGLLIDGNMTIDGNLNLGIDHCTLMPLGLSALESNAREAPLQITLDHSIVGPIHLRVSNMELNVQDCILDSASGDALNALASGPIVTLQRVTIFGEVQAHTLKLAENVIFTRRVHIREENSGLVSFCYVPQRSQTPYRDHCQNGPALRLENGVLRDPGLEEFEGRVSQRERIYPEFTSTRYGDPGYAQLRIDCPREILRGATDGSEMGAFHDLFQAQRQDNLLQILDEYLPFGLATGITYIT